MIHDEGCRVVMQPTFTGRNGEMWSPAVPSQEEILRIVQTSGESAVRAQEAGFFLSQFLNATKNTRTGDYAGTPELRAGGGKDLEIFIKINCSDFLEDDGVFAACRYACTPVETSVPLTDPVRNNPERFLEQSEKPIDLRKGE